VHGEGEGPRRQGIELTNLEADDILDLLYGNEVDRNDDRLRRAVL